jgi:hypothetical protein
VGFEAADPADYRSGRATHDRVDTAAARDGGCGSRLLLL